MYDRSVQKIAALRGGQPVKNTIHDEGQNKNIRSGSQDETREHSCETAETLESGAVSVGRSQGARVETQTVQQTSGMRL